MLKSLFSGVSGLQSHQVAMDVESNNIANVNTVGFKYSRANFSDLLAQTKSIATAPQGDLGGKNAVQVGLGASVASMTKIFSQGSIQNSDKNTDVAIQGDGFFIVSSDAGDTYKYTRAGDFKFDADGNFVDNNGYVAQGWVRDSVTGIVDSTAPISNIQIAPGLTTPASATKEVVLKANLNSGSKIESASPAYAVDTNGNVTDTNGNAISSGDLGVMYNDSGDAFSLQDDQGIWASFVNSTSTAAGNVVAGTGNLDITFTLDDGTTQNITTSNAAATVYTAAENGARYVSAINTYTSTTGITATYDSGTNEISLENENDSSSRSHNIQIAAVGNANSGFDATEDSVTAYRYQYSGTGASSVAGSDKTFKTIADLRDALQDQAQAQYDDGDAIVESNISVTVSAEGKIEITNPGGADDDYDMNLTITALVDSTNSITENVHFTTNMTALNTSLAAGSTGTAFSQTFNAATHSSSIDIFDSLGSKHTLRMEFRKTEMDTSTGSTWATTLSVPAPATISTTFPFDEETGSITFNNDGSISTSSPSNISFSGNNGSAADQQINLEFGSSNAFDGMTSFDSESSTSGISQDGYTGGDLVGIRIDQSGTLVGSFSNGRSFGLAQIGMAKFTNNEGLTTEGGNTFIQTANSGDPIIGTAATSGRGFIQSAALEASNVDLSRALTQLIIIQRGFQANGKTITTSDQLLQTLIGLKN